MKKPAREAREMAFSSAENAEVVETVTDPCFRDLLELAWETGSRPQELLKLEARYLDMESSRVVFPPEQAKAKKYFRTIYLTERAGLSPAWPTPTPPASCCSIRKATGGRRTPSTAPSAALRRRRSARNTTSARSARATRRRP